ncbi:helix-turn-helix transcriptional regulator [Halobacillus salinus]|uniref:helix-turn-helix transcriptional regulator n=1 Tax=Halobacillus salinus TaxID=192814 RepID=UPI0009A83318|nr:helix-turn-helix transcriptional regulator [Halobacillus salinus]
MRKWLRKYRIAKCYTQEKTAKESGISRSYYTHIESGVKNPTVSTAKKIAKSLNFNWTLFFEDERSLEELKFDKEVI